MIPTILVEDDIQSIDSLKSIIQFYNIEIELLGVASTVKTARDIIEAKKPDLLLLDIELPDGTSLDLLRQLSYKPWNIFITGHIDYIFDTLDFATIHYLIKPVNATKLAEAVQKYQYIINQYEKTSKTDNDKLKIKKYFEKIAIPTLNGNLIVEVSQIMRLEGESNYTNIYLADGQKFLISKTLSTFEEILPEDIFVRVHKSHIVNIGYIKSILKANPPYILMSNSIEIPISLNKRDLLMKKLEENIFFFH